MKVTVKCFISSCVECSSCITDHVHIHGRVPSRARQPPLGEGLWRQGRSAAEREGEGSESCTSSNLMLHPLSPQKLPAAALMKLTRVKLSLSSRVKLSEFNFS